MHRKAREDVEVGFEVWFESLKPGTQRLTAQHDPAVYSNSDEKAFSDAPIRRSFAKAMASREIRYR
jgi:hypothetical protein